MLSSAVFCFCYCLGFCCLGFCCSSLGFWLERPEKVPQPGAESSASCFQYKFTALQSSVQDHWATTNLRVNLQPDAPVIKGLVMHEKKWTRYKRDIHGTSCGCVKPLSPPTIYPPFQETAGEEITICTPSRISSSFQFFIEDEDYALLYLSIHSPSYAPIPPFTIHLTDKRFYS